MASTLGFTALLLIIALNFFLPLFNFCVYKNLFKINKNDFEQIAFTTITTTFCAAIIAQLCLAYCYVISNYSILNVYQNSHHLKPLIYKIAGSWGNHEGSMLLLLTILSGYSFIFTLTNKSEFKDIASSVQSVVIGSFALFTAFASNPFEMIFPAPQSGLGLNPLLQDIGLALHPPMLYIGYIGFFITFSLALAALFLEKVDKNLAKNIQPWLFTSFGFLTLGVALGSWWAYRELGWGGYWFWDPVENVSLMPWLSSCALIHCVKVLQKKGDFKIWTILLSIITFILSLIGIFLVRSGLLTSVHSFAVDAKRGFFIILLIVAIGGLSMLAFALKANKIKSQSQEQNKFLSKITMILLNNYFLMIALFTMLLGIFYPIFSQSFFASSISIGADYYNKIFAILLVPFLIFLALSYFEKTSIKIIKKPRYVLPALVAIIITIIFALNSRDAAILEIVIFFLALECSFLAFFSKKNSANLAHLGFSVILLGIILSSYLGTTKEINIKENEIVEISQNSALKVKFEKVEYLAGSNFLAREAIFAIIKNDKEISKLAPQLRYYPISDQTTFEADIKHGIFGDLYLAIGNKDENEYYALRIYDKPFVSLIWIGSLLIFLSALIKIFKIARKK